MAAFSWDEEVWRVDAEELGDLDPLAPGGDILTDADADFHEDDASGPTGGGATDGRGVVSVWVEAGRLTKVRVSPQWHTKLGRGSLTDSFAQALAFANASVADYPVQPATSYDDVDFSELPRFDTTAFAAFQTVFAEVEERWDQALVRHAEQPPSSAPATLGKYKGVTVSLNSDGVASGVTFDKVWLESAQAGTICTHVMRAAEKAYAHFTPAENDRAELDDIAAEHEFLLAAFKAMLNPKERS